MEYSDDASSENSSNETPSKTGTALKRVYNFFDLPIIKFSLIGFFVLFIDGCLNTVIGPIMPSYLSNMRLEKYNLSIANFSSGSIFISSGNYSLEEFLNYVESTDDLMSTNTMLTILYAAKPTLQLLVNPFVGIVTHKVGYTIPMTIGLCIASCSTIIFAFGGSYITMLISRLIQGIGTSFGSVSAFGLCAHEFQHNDVARASIISTAMTGVATGMLLGPAFGGVLYQFAGLATPFMIIAAVILSTLTFQVIFIRPKYLNDIPDGPSSARLLMDPYILLTAVGIVVANLGDALYEPTLPFWLLTTFNTPPWLQGLIMTSPLVFYIISNNFLKFVSQKMGRWFASMVGFSFCATGFFLMPFSSYALMVCIFYGLFGFGLGLIESSLMPLMAYLVDLRHSKFYGNVYAIADNSFNLAFALGNSTAGFIVSGLSFTWLCWICAIIITVYTPFLIFLRNPPPKNSENTPLVE